MYGKVGDLSMFLKALQTKTDFTVLSRPSIFTSNNQKGTISSGERIAIPTGSTSYRQRQWLIHPDPISGCRPETRSHPAGQFQQ